MELAKPEDTPSPMQIDYALIARKYNTAEQGGSVKMKKVYNITLFKKALSRRGVRESIDFQAFNQDGFTYVKRISALRMTEV